MIHKGLALNNVRINTSVASGAIFFSDAYKIGFHSVITGSPAGILKLQVSNDLTDVADEVISWTDVDGSSLNISVADQYVYSVNSLAMKWIRIVYIPSGGDGFITTTFYGIA